MRALMVVAAFLLTLLAVVVGLAKVQRLPASLQVRDQAQIAPVVWTVTGWVELIAAAGLIVGVFVSLELALVGAVILLVSYLALAIRQLTQRLTPAATAPAFLLSVLAAVTAASIVASG
jgi:uncharacterized membrane protein YphA (DoxX/SURF4 family)